MTDPTFLEIMDALAGQIRDEIAGTASPVIPDLQVEGRLIFNPTPPTVDIYPADPFIEQIAFGLENSSLYFTVRARVATSDNDAGQEDLLNLMDLRSAASIEQAIVSDKTLGGKVQRAKPEPPSGFKSYQDSGGQGQWLGCEWRVEVIL